MGYGVFVSSSSSTTTHPLSSRNVNYRLRTKHRYLNVRSCSTAAAASVSLSAPGTKQQQELSNNVIDILEARGLVESTSGDKLKQACQDSTVKVYCGFDPTAESLHLGNLMGIVVLSWFQRCGHQVVAVLGGATARVGDPSGKSSERPVMSDETIEKNSTAVGATLSRILDDAPVVNNYEWWKTMTLLDFLRDVGKHGRVGSMLAKESVRRRISSEDGISFTEFTYQLLQGYDFVHLFKTLGVSVEIGGSDQWGNITAGIDLVRKLLHRDDAHGLTFPLLLKSDGTKFGKSEGGAIWLSPALLSPYQFYQHLFAIPDSDVIKLLKQLTFVELEEIQSLEQSMSRPDYVPNTAQRKLAEEVTRFVHGDDGVAEAIKVTQALAPGSTVEVDWRVVEAIGDEIPSCQLCCEDVVEGQLLDLCVKSGLTPSKAAARRLMRQGGIYLNNAKVDDEKRVVQRGDLIRGNMLLLSAHLRRGIQSDPNETTKTGG